MFNKEEYIEMLKSLPFGVNDQEIEQQAQGMEDKLATVTTGDDVIHLEYFYGVLNELDIAEYENELNAVGLRLSHFNKNGIVFNSLEDYSLQVYFALSLSHC